VSEPTRRRSWRLGAIALGVLALLLAGLYAVLIVVFPPERLAALLVQQVKTATGRDFRIDGGVSIQVFPVIAVHANDIVLGNASWGSRPEMLRVRHAAFDVSVQALLTGEVRILRVEVDGVDALLESDGAGRANWQFAAPSAATTASAPAVPGRASMTYQLDELALADVQVAYRASRDAAPRTLAIDSLHLKRIDEKRDRLVATFAVGGQHWQAKGEVGPFDVLLAANTDWPFQVALSAEGVTVAATGSVGLGPRAGAATVDLSADVATAAALQALVPGAPALPMPLGLRVGLRRDGGELRADPLHVSLAGQAIDGRLTLHSDVSPPSIDAVLSSKSLDLATWRVEAPAAKARAVPKPPGRLFGDTTLPIGTLPNVALRLALDVDRVSAPGVPPLSELRAHLVSRPGAATLDGLRFDMAGGHVEGRISLVQEKGAPPRTAIALEAKSLSIETLSAASGSGGHFRGGRADLSLKLAMTGDTPHKLAASVNGELLFSGSGATLAGSAAALDRNVLVSLLHLLIPTQSPSQGLVVECAVARLPLKGGVAIVDRSIALETHEVAVVASGRLSLVEETIRLEFRPHVKKGLGLSPASLAQLMVLSGPLRDPQVGVDAAGAVRSVGTVGVAVATSGLSLLVPKVAGASKDAPACGQAAAETVEKPASEKSPRPRLFGK
jgi:hypothetical protein